MDKLIVAFMTSILIILVVLVAYIAFDATTGYTCIKVADAMKVPQQYSFWSGCVIYIDGQWIPYDKYEYIDYEK